MYISLCSEIKSCFAKYLLLLILSRVSAGEAIALGLDELASLLTTQGLGKYTDVFLRHEVDLQTFATLTDEELKEIGIPTFGARKKLLLLARETKKKFELS